MDNFKELQFAVNQLLREKEKPSPKYVQIVDQILQELLEKAHTGSVEVEEEVNLQAKAVVWILFD